jgi:AraC family transcriptional regulator
MTPHQYQLYRRIERAKELLADRSLSLASLSVAVGFSSQSHFSTAFRKIAGTSPHRFRSEL